MGRRLLAWPRDGTGKSVKSEAELDVLVYVECDVYLRPAVAAGDTQNKALKAHNFGGGESRSPNNGRWCGNHLLPQTVALIESHSLLFPLQVQDSDIRTDIRPSKEEVEKQKRKQAAAAAAKKARKKEEGEEEEGG